VPLFLVAGAIVVEEGGPLSHAAIVARELGVPAVVNVPGIVDRLTRVAGDATVTVDGSTGEVSLHAGGETEPASGVAPLRRLPVAIDASPGGLHVFVTGLIGVGATLSVVVALTEAVGSARGRARIRRRAEPIAQMAAAGVIEGFEAVAAHPVGVRARRWYAIAAALLLLVAAAFGARSAIGYWQSDPDGVGTTLGWAAGCMSSATLAAAGGTAAAAARRWPRVPAVVRRVTGRRLAGPRLVELLGRRAVTVAATGFGVVALLAALVAVRFGPLERFDRWLYDRMDAGGGAERWAPDWMNVLGKPAVVVALAVVLAVISFRCRVFAPSIPLAIVTAGLTVLSLTWLTMRDRPELGGHAGEHNSFPGGHAAQLTILFGVLPLVVRVLTGRRWVHGSVRVLSTALLAVLLADTVRTGGHWPTDQVAGALIGVALLAVVHGYVAHADHSGCRPHPPIAGSRRR
jgi:membrane-associated phospholipid phosphatase